MLAWDCSKLVDQSRVPNAVLEHIPTDFTDLQQYQESFTPMLLQEIQAHVVQALEHSGVELKGQLLSADGASDFHTLKMGLGISSPDVREKVSNLTSPTDWALNCVVK